MTDLEKVTRCAERIGITGWLTQDDPMVTNAAGEFIEPYDPLTNKAQAFELMERLKLHPVYDAEERVWHCVTLKEGIYGRDSDLCRAIVDCVSQIPE